MLKPITQQSADRISALVVGPAGSGKTSLIRTIMGQHYDPLSNGWIPADVEPSEKVCVLSAEAGLLCIRDLVAKGFVEGYEIGSFSDMEEVISVLSAPECRARYGWIFIDSLTEIGSKCAEAMKAKYPSSSQSFPMWGEYSDRMTRLIKAFRDLTAYNVIFTCLESVDKDEAGRRFTSPALQGSSLKERLTSYFDEVFHMEERISEDGVPIRYFNTASPLGLSKDRSGKLNAIEEPNLLTVKTKILG